eukprot:364810-Chlamydomonas_euryale.AAC.14
MPCRTADRLASKRHCACAQAGQSRSHKPGLCASLLPCTAASATGPSACCFKLACGSCCQVSWHVIHPEHLLDCWELRLGPACHGPGSSRCLAGPVVD